MRTRNEDSGCGFITAIYIEFRRGFREMSQSDYIQYKKTGVQLRDTASVGVVFPYSLYHEFTGYNIENTTVNTAVNYGKPTVPANVTQVFGMKLAHAGASCPTFACFGIRNRIT